MRKWLALAIQLPFLAMVWAGCNGDNPGQGDGGDAASDVKIDKKVLPDTGPGDTGPVCAPSSTVDTSQIKWVPPIAPSATACSDAQIQAYWDDCFGTNATSTTCQAFTNATANQACYKCLLTPDSASAYGALIAIGGVDYANISGCIAIMTGDSTATGCGAKVESVTECENLACTANCPSVVDDATFQQFTQCTNAADQGVCKTYVDAQCDLSDAGAVYDTCENHQDFQSYYNAIAPVFCGGYPADAGTDAGMSDASDDGSADAATDAADGD